VASKLLLLKSKPGRDIGGQHSDVPSLGGDHAAHRERQISIFAKKYFVEKHFDEKKIYEGWPVVRFGNGEVRTIYADCATSEYKCKECRDKRRAKEQAGAKTAPGDDVKCTLYSRTQIPLAPGYAITINKSQASLTAGSKPYLHYSPDCFPTLLQDDHRVRY
jgi:hypothetical protein